MLITILMFIFLKFLLVIFVGQIWSQNLKFSKLTAIGTLLHIFLYKQLIFFGQVFGCLS